MSEFNRRTVGVPIGSPAGPALGGDNHGPGEEGTSGERDVRIRRLIGDARRLAVSPRRIPRGARRVVTVMIRRRGPARGFPVLVVSTTALSAIGASRASALVFVRPPLRVLGAVVFSSLSAGGSCVSLLLKDRPVLITTP